jgi:hypothetical protein
MKKIWLTAGALGLLALAAGCAAGPQGPFDAQHPAGFWAGLWHGFITWITFVISLFSSVKIYAAHNTGWPYDLGFIIGMACWLGGGGGGSWRASCKRRRDREWEEVGRQVEAKLKRDLAAWAEAGDPADWADIEQKFEAKLRQKVKDWAQS